MGPTEKQVNRINKLISCLGEKRVKEYFANTFPDVYFSNMTRPQAQKVITGLQTFEPRKPIYGVVGRDIPFSNQN